VRSLFVASGHALMTGGRCPQHTAGVGRHLADASPAGALYDLADSSTDVSVTVESPTLNRYDGVVASMASPSSLLRSPMPATAEQSPVRPGRVSASGLTLTPTDGCVPMTCLTCRPRVGRVDR